MKQVPRDLFYMIGLDQPPVPVEQRAQFEKENQRGWALLPTDQE